MTEIGYYSILISLFLSAYCGIALIIGIKNRRAEVIASAERTRVEHMHEAGEARELVDQAVTSFGQRLAERGVRFVELLPPARKGVDRWDQHGNLPKAIATQCEETDQASAALVQDLKQRGMLDDTLVIWGGEFGRTPMVQGGGNDGRDHHPNAFTMWMAGGGVKGGINYGSTDDYGYYAVENKVHIHDLHATILHLLGLDHEKLTYRFAGRDFRLTDVSGTVVHDIIA